MTRRIMKKFEYVGNGMGVPGLPHLVSDDEAAELGVLHILNEAVKNGSYVEVTPPPAPPQMGERNLGRGAKNKGVNNG